jgi:hypothetical protein
MPAEDLDRLFEKALVRHLRANAAAAADSTCAMCPDAEILAGYHEGTLSPEEISAVRSHVALCDRCKDVLAEMEITQDANDVVPSGAISSANDSIPGANTNQPAPLAMARSKAVTFQMKTSSRLRWAAPAGAIAAGLLLWIGIRDYRLQLKNAGPATQIAENRSYAQPTAPIPPAEPESITKQKTENLERRQAREELKGDASGSASAPLRDEMQNFRKSAKSSPKLRADAGKELPGSAPSEMRKVPAPQPESGNRGSSAVAEEGAAKTENPNLKLKDSALDAVQIDGQSAQEDQGKQPLSGGTISQPAAPTTAARGNVTQTGQAQAEIVTSTSGLKKDQAASFSNALFGVADLPVTVAAPGGKIIWRFGEHGAIAHSGDGGNSWQTQSAASTATLTAGYAPSNKICWIAGTAGTLLRTTDGGNHWELVITPISADIGGIRASDAKHATIWDISNRLSYETIDGGLTWKRIANE